jgi:hypothetical protein
MYNEDLLKEVIKLYLKEERGIVDECLPYKYNISKVDDFGSYMRFHMETTIHNQFGTFTKSMGSLHITIEDYSKYLRQYKLNMILKNS